MCGCEQGSGAGGVASGGPTSAGVSTRQAPTSGAAVEAPAPSPPDFHKQPGERHAPWRSGARRHARRAASDPPALGDRNARDATAVSGRGPASGPPRGLASARAVLEVREATDADRRDVVRVMARGLRRRPRHPVAGAARALPGAALRRPCPVGALRSGLHRPRAARRRAGRRGVLGPARLPGAGAAADRGDPVLRAGPGPPILGRGVDGRVGDAPGPPARGVLVPRRRRRGPARRGHRVGAAAAPARPGPRARRTSRAASSENIPLYERFGFELREAISLPDGPDLWPMWRAGGSAAERGVPSGGRPGRQAAEGAPVTAGDTPTWTQVVPQGGGGTEAGLLGDASTAGRSSPAGAGVAHALLEQPGPGDCPVSALKRRVKVRTLIRACRPAPGTSVRGARAPRRGRRGASLPSSGRAAR